MSIKGLLKQLGKRKKSKLASARKTHKKREEKLNKKLEQQDNLLLLLAAKLGVDKDELLNRVDEINQVLSGTAEKQLLEKILKIHHFDGDELLMNLSKGDRETLASEAHSMVNMRVFKFVLNEIMNKQIVFTSLQSCNYTEVALGRGVVVGVEKVEELFQKLSNEHVDKVNREKDDYAFTDPERFEITSNPKVG